MLLVLHHLQLVLVHSSVAKQGHHVVVGDEGFGVLREALDVAAHRLVAGQAVASRASIFMPAREIAGLTRVDCAPELEVFRRRRVVGREDLNFRRGHVQSHWASRLRTTLAFNHYVKNALTVSSSLRVHPVRFQMRLHLLQMTCLRLDASLEQKRNGLGDLRVLYAADIEQLDVRDKSVKLV